MATRFWTDCEGFYRRDFLKIGVAGLFGLDLPTLLRLEAKAKAARTSHGLRKHRADSVIMVWLGGGPATIDMWDLKPEAPQEIRGNFKPISTAVVGMQMCEHLPQLAKATNQLTLVRSLHHTVPAHGPATVFMTTGNKPTPALQYPSLGSLTARLLPAEPGVPPYVTFNSKAVAQGGYLGTAYNPFVVEGAGGKGKAAANMQVRGISLPKGFTLDTLDNRDKLLAGFDQDFAFLDKSSDLVDGLDTFHRQALEILRSNKTKKAFDLAREPGRVRQRYGFNAFGQSALAARRLVEAGVRFVTISLGGWDTHGQNFTTLSRQLLPQLDRTLSALIEDLAHRGQLDRTIVYCTGEFGRTPKINGKQGRDHWSRAMAAIVAGGPFRRGYVHGSTDAQGTAPTKEPCTPDDISATLVHALGIDPHQELMTPSGRPIQLFREGTVVEKLLA